MAVHALCAVSRAAEAMTRAIAARQKQDLGDQKPHPAEGGRYMQMVVELWIGR